MSRWVAIFFVCSSLAAEGCANVQLRKSTVRQASTLTDLQYQQVLDNLGMFAADPGALPWHVNLKNGAVQVTDSGTAGFLGQTDFMHLFASSPNVIGTRSIVQQWGSVPVTDDVTLRLLRTAYQIAIGARTDREIDKELADDLAHTLKNQTATNADMALSTQLFNSVMQQYAQTPMPIPDLNSFIKLYVTAENQTLINANIPDFETRGRVAYPETGPLPPTTALARDVIRQVDNLKDELRKIPTDWFGRGHLLEVPLDACYVGKYGKCYTWVKKEHRDELAAFTLNVLTLASAVKEPQVISAPSGVQFSPGISRPGP